MLLQVVGGFAFLLGLTLLHRGTMSQLLRTPQVFAAALALGVFTTALVGVAAVVASPSPWRRRISLPSLRAAPVDVLLVLVAAFGIGGLSSGIAHRLGLDAHSTLRAFEAASAAASPAGLAVFILLGALAGLAEELLFRGYAQTRLASRWGPWVAITLAALFFGGLHFDLVQGAFAFLVGLLLGWVAVQRRSIATGIYAHAANNAVSFSLMWLLAGTGDGPLYSTWIDLVLSVSLVGGSLFLLRRRMVQSPVQEPVSLPAEAESAPRPARRRVFIWVGFGCLLLIAIPSLLLAGFVAIRLLSPERSALRAQGSAFGAQHVDRACLDAAILGGHGIPRDASDDLRRVFLNACLRKAQRTASFCEGVPAFTAFTKHRAWTREACKLRPAGSRRTCVAVSAALLGYCSYHPAR